ncbi:MAG: response regulator, partial [Hyphomicrobiaceae bacterium]|nr:response regulator [Hyphomicrobiaceae bacterium]
DDIALITRVKNLARLKALNDEMMQRMSSGDQWPKAESGGRILLVEDSVRTARLILAALGKQHEVQVEPSVPAAVAHLADKPCDLIIVSLNLAAADGLLLCSQLRASERTPHLPIIVIVQPGEDARLLRALDLGVNDYLTRPVDRNELLARVRTQIRRKGHSDYLRERLEESVELPLTGAA